MAVGSVAVLHGYQERNKAEYLRVSVICPIFADEGPPMASKKPFLLLICYPFISLAGLLFENHALAKVVYLLQRNIKHIDKRKTR